MHIFLLIATVLNLGVSAHLVTGEGRLIYHGQPSGPGRRVRRGLNASSLLVKRDEIPKPTSVDVTSTSTVNNDSLPVTSVQDLGSSKDVPCGIPDRAIYSLFNSPERLPISPVDCEGFLSIANELEKTPGNFKGFVGTAAGLAFDIEAPSVAIAKNDVARCMTALHDDLVSKQQRDPDWIPREGQFYIVDRSGPKAITLVSGWTYIDGDDQPVNSIFPITWGVHKVNAMYPPQARKLQPAAQVGSFLRTITKKLVELQSIFGNIDDDVVTEYGTVGRETVASTVWIRETDGQNAQHRAAQITAPAMCLDLMAYQLPSKFLYECVWTCTIGSGPNGVTVEGAFRVLRGNRLSATNITETTAR